MGSVYMIKCTNKECGYSVRLREGESLFHFAKIRKLENQIKESRNAPTEILELLDSGKHLSSVTSYLCPTCKEWLTDDKPFVYETLQSPPHSAIKEYKLHYLSDKPKCKKCKTELIHIQNVLSGKNKCPKCECGKMTGRKTGSFD